MESDHARYCQLWGKDEAEECRVYHERGGPRSKFGIIWDFWELQSPAYTNQRAVLLKPLKLRSTDVQFYLLVLLLS